MRDPREKLIDDLEALIREHRAGRDVLNRTAEGVDRAGDGAVRLTSVLTLALRGWDAIPDFPNTSRRVWYPGCDGIVCNASEHAALVAIGEGRAEDGAARLVAAALSWLKRDRKGFVEWAGRALRRLKPRRGNPVARKGLLGAEWWEVPVAGEWFTLIADAADEAQAQAPARTVRRYLGGFSAWDIMRAMLSDWDRPALPELASCPIFPGGAGKSRKFKYPATGAVKIAPAR